MSDERRGAADVILTTADLAALTARKRPSAQRRVDAMEMHR
jgi:hypothetical protein